MNLFTKNQKNNQINVPPKKTEENREKHKTVSRVSVYIFMFFFVWLAALIDECGGVGREEPYRIDSSGSWIYVPGNWHLSLARYVIGYDRVRSSPVLQNN